MGKLKILMFAGSLTPYRLDFYNEFSKLFDLKIYFFHSVDPSQNFDVKALEEKAVFSFDYITRGFKLFSRHFRYGVWPIIIKEKPDILMTHEFSGFSLRALLLKKMRGEQIKWFITSDDSLGSLENMPAYRRIARRLILPNIDGLITINKAVKNWHLKKYPFLDLEIFDLPILRNPEIFREELKRALPISEKYIAQYKLQDKKIILFIGRLVDVKGVDRLVQVFCDIHEEDATLILVGDGILKDSLKEYIISKNEKRIILPGRYDNLELLAWYNVGDIFILPSYYEPFGAVINEALLSGLYTICSKKAGAQCLINENENGKLIDPLDNDDIYIKLSEVIHKGYSSKKKEIIVKKNLNTENFSKKMIELNDFMIKQSVK